MSKLLDSTFSTTGDSQRRPAVAAQASNNRKLSVDVLVTSAVAIVATNAPTVVQLGFTVTGHLTNVSFAG